MTIDLVFSAPQASAERKAFYQRIGGDGLTPLSEVLGALVPPEPRTPCQPALSHSLYAAGAERRWGSGGSKLSG